MPAVTDLANAAAAVTAGYAQFNTSRVISSAKGSTTEFTTRFEKRLTGEAGTTGFIDNVVGTSTVDAATATAAALAALNAQRRHRYAGAPGQPSTGGAGMTAWPDGAATAPVVDTN